MEKIFAAFTFVVLSFVFLPIALAQIDLERRGLQNLAGEKPEYSAHADADQCAYSRYSYKNGWVIYIVERGAKDAIVAVKPNDEVLVDKNDDGIVDEHWLSRDLSYKKYTNICNAAVK